MSYSYLFFRPARLPLTAAELSGETVLPVGGEAGEIRAALGRVLPGIEWVSPTEGRVSIDDMWMEFFLNPADGSLSLRCSLRQDYRAIVQQLCDRLGWLAFDEQPMCFQPGLPPMPA